MNKGISYPLRPCWGTSPKYDNLKSGCKSKAFIVVFEGGKVLSAMGLMVVRFRNDEVVRESVRSGGENQRIHPSSFVIHLCS